MNTKTIILGSIVYLVCMGLWSSLTEAKDLPYAPAHVVTYKCNSMFNKMLEEEGIKDEYTVVSTYSNQGVAVISYKTSGKLPAIGIMYCGINKHNEILNADLYTVLIKLGRGV
tara:strand:- start:7851 stop:8189 length:339 start_codon:yes stop_codon:yes gene_type:complete